MTLYALLAGNLLGHAADAWLTYHGLQCGYEEGNPIAVYLMSRFGAAQGLLLLKLIAGGFFIGLVRLAPAPLARSVLLFLLGTILVPVLSWACLLHAGACW